MPGTPCVMHSNNQIHTWKVQCRPTHFLSTKRRRKAQMDALLIPAMNAPSSSDKPSRPHSHAEHRHKLTRLSCTSSPLAYLQADTTKQHRRHASHRTWQHHQTPCRFAPRHGPSPYLEAWVEYHVCSITQQRCKGQAVTPAGCLQ